jgi:hypothetical protein
MRSRPIVEAVLIAALAMPPAARAAAPLETETARFHPRGTIEAEAVLEHQRAADGHETALPLAFEVALTDRVALLAEPVPYTKIAPASGPSSHGQGDLEVTLEGLVHPETRWPAFALAGEVKVPTAEAPLIGSDQYDWTIYAIASRWLGRRLDTHVNLGYTIIGHPAGVPVNNTWNVALAGEYTWSARWSAVAEVLANTSALPENSGESVTTPEISAGEVTGMLGARYAITRGIIASFGVTVDNNGAVLYRPGLTARCR